MSRLHGGRHGLAEMAGGNPVLDAMKNRMLVLERLVRAIEDELADNELDDEQKLQNIGERVAEVMDGEC